MSQRLRGYDVRISRFPRLLGLCQGATTEVWEYLNAAQRRLLYAREAGEESWYGTFAEIAFTLTQDVPYVTLPREIARLELATVCDNPIPVSNEFIQYLQFGNGRLRKNRRCGPEITESVTRNNAVTWTDLSNAPQYLRAYISDDRDIGKRTLLQGTDSNSNVIYSTDNLIEVTGIFVAFESPFATSTLTFNSISGIQKDTTYGKVDYYQVDPTTGEEVLLLTMQPSETTASYRRYYFNNLPCTCCPNPSASTDSSVDITAIAKLDLVPVTCDTDYCLFQNLEALIHEGQSIGYDEADTASAKQMAINEHVQAIRLLNGELGHFYGLQAPAVNFAPFGSARLERVNIGMV